MTLGPPATRAECYLAAILDELRALRADLAGGGQEQEPPVQGVLTVSTQQNPTKRTRQRAARTN